MAIEDEDSSSAGHKRARIEEERPLPPIPDSGCLLARREWAEKLDPRDATGEDWEGNQVYGGTCEECKFVNIIAVVDWIMAFFLMRLTQHNDFKFKVVRDGTTLVYRRSREGGRFSRVRIDFSQLLGIIGNMDGVHGDEEHDIPAQPEHPFEYHIPFSHNGGRWRTLDVERMARGDALHDIKGIEDDVFAIINNFMDTGYHVDGDAGCHTCVLNACYASDKFKDRVFQMMLAKLCDPSNRYTRATTPAVNAELSRP